MSGPHPNNTPATPRRTYPPLESIVPHSRLRPLSSHAGRPSSVHAVRPEDALSLPSPSLGRPHQQATLERPPHTRLSCSICGSTAIQERSLKEIQDLRQYPTDVAVSAILDLKETIGGFLVKLFESKRIYTRSSRTTAALAAFLDGHTAVGTRPADVVEAIYRHPFGTQYATNGQPVTSHPPFPTYSCPPPDPHITLGNLTNSTLAIDGEMHDDDDTTDSEFSSSSLEIGEAGEGDGVSSERRGEEVAMEEHDGSRDSGGPGDSDPEPGLDEMENGDEGPEPPSAEARVSAASPSAHAALQAWALSLVLHQIDLEMRSLTAGEVLRASNASFTWDFLFNFSLGTAQDAIVATAPFLWLILTTAAIGGRMRRGVSSGQTKDRKGRRINRRNPWLACTVIVFILAFFRNRECNLLAAIMGTFLFGCRSNSAVFAIFGRCGLTTSYSATLARLHLLGRSALSRLHDLASSPTQSFLLLYDNINKQKRVWRHQLGLRDVVKSGTAATAVVLEDVESGAFDAEPYLERIQQGLRQQLTVQTLVQDIRQDHISNVAAANIAFILTKHVPALRRFRPFVRHLISQRFAVHQLRLRKSRYYPMSTSGLDESTTAGNIKILFDLVITQMKLAPSRLHHRLILVCGDLMTVNRLRTVKTNTQVNLGEYDQHAWVLPIAQLWHLKWAFLKGIVKCHWAPRSGKHIYGLRRDAEALGRHINPKQCDFYPTHRLVETVYEAMVLHSARLLLRELLPPSMPPPNAKFQLLEELAFHFGSAGHFNAQQLSDEDFYSLAVRLARRFTSNTALGDAEGVSTRSPLIYGPNTATEPSILQEDTDMEPSEEANRIGPDDLDGEGDSEEEEEAENIDLANLDPENWQGDRVLYNITLFMTHASWYYELHVATEDGDTGRIFEVQKLLRFFFWGSGSHNYGSELLHMACGFLYEFPDKLKSAILDNYLVNPSGLPGRWHPHDLLQEHQNFALKRVFPDQDTDFDSAFLREVVGPNISAFGYLREGLYRLFGLNHGRNKKSKLDTSADINILGALYLRENTHVFCQGRRQPFASVDAFSRGYQKLEGGQLEVFLGRTKEE